MSRLDEIKKQKEEMIKSRTSINKNVIVKRDKVQIGLRQISGNIKNNLSDYHGLIKQLVGIKFVFLSVLFLVTLTILLTYSLNYFTISIGSPARPLEVFGLISVGGEEYNITQRLGGIETEVIIPLSDGKYEKRMAYINYQSINTTILLDYYVLQDTDGNQMNNKGGIIKNRIVFDIIKTQKKEYAAHIALVVQLLLLNIYVFINRAFGHKLGQSLMSGRVKRK